MKRSLLTAFVAAMAMTAVLATVGFGATKKSNKPSKGKTNSSQTQTQTGPPPTMSEMLAKRTAEKTAHQAALAAELGVTDKQLSDAIDSAKSDKLDADVAANKLTAAERTAIIACESAPLTCDRSDLPAGGPGGPGGPGERGHRGGPDGGPAAIASALAAKLNLPEATVAAALKKTQPARPAGDHRGPGGPRGQAGPAGFAAPMGMN